MSVLRVVIAGCLGAIAGALALSYALAQAPQPAATASPASAKVLPPLEELQVTRERPLFAPDRRPDAAPTEVESEPEAAVEEGTELAFELTGIVIGPQVAVAILHNKTTNEFQRLRRGETIDRWKIEEIQARQVVLRRDSRRVRLQLFGEEKAADATAEARVAGAEREITPQETEPETEEVEDPPQDTAPQKPPRRRMPLSQLPKETK